MPLVARIAADLGLPGHPVEAADAARDKEWMKQRFSAAGIPIARYTLATNEDAAVHWADESGYPVVVKPVRGSASQAVIRANDETELRDAYRWVRRIVREQGLDTGGRSDAEQLVEGYLDGAELSAELLVQDGIPHVLCLFEKPQPLHGPFFEETIYVTPTSLDAQMRTDIEALAVRATEALGLHQGFAHCEIRMSSGGPVILEIGARLIGGACSRVFRYVIGEDIHAYVLRLALGDHVALPVQQPVAAGAMMLPLPGEGRLAEIRGVHRARQVPGIQDVIIDTSPGEVIVPFPEQSCYIGFLTAKGETPAGVADALARANAQIELELEPLTCERWVRDIDDQAGYQAPPEHGIRALEGLSLERAHAVVVPLVAATHFAEFPGALATAKADACVRWLEEGNKGETSPALWLVSEGRGVALGSYNGERCFISCLGVLPGNQGAGLGESLVRSLMALCVQRGCSVMEEQADPRHTAGMRLFERLGFVRDGADEQNCCSCP
jgi:biotin carboxylase